MNDCAYYVAFIMDHEVRTLGGTVLVEAGIDLLAGPFANAHQAREALVPACRAHPRLAAFAALAAFVTKNTETPPTRIAVLPVTPAMCAREAQRHATPLAWPPPILMPADTAGVPSRRRPVPAATKETLHGTP